VKARYTKIITLAALLVLLCFSCSTDLKLTKSAEPEVTVAPENEVGNWEDCGGKIGEHACNFAFKDQNGKDWRLYDHYNDIIVLDFSTMWCSVCMGVAVRVEEFQDRYGKEDAIWVTVLLQDLNGRLPTVQHVYEWARAFDIETAPVLVADESVFDIVLEEGYNVVSLPTIIIIDREMVNVQLMVGWNQYQLIKQVEQLILGM